MNLEKRLKSAAQELNDASRLTAPPALTSPSERIRPWMAFAAAFAVVLAVIGIPFVLTNFGTGAPSDGGPLAGISTTTSSCVDASTTTIELDPDSTTSSVAGEAISTLPPTSEATTDEPPTTETTDCVPGETTTTVVETTTPGPACAAGELYPPTTLGFSDDNDGSDPRDLTEPVKQKLTEIAEAAAGCNASALAALASDDITTTYGPGSGPGDIASWTDDDERFEIITELFNMTHAVTEMPDGSALYVWPTAFAYDTWDEIPAPAMDELLRIYTQKELDQISLLGSYGGWRIGITEAGEWIFFVAGD